MSTAVIQASFSRSDSGSSAAAAGAIPLGRGFTLGAGGYWHGPGEAAALQFSACRVITGDPIGFMEGLYGPSITAGVSLRGQYARENGEYSAGADAGIQFSIFPSFALGVACTDLSGELIFHTGFSHVFNRNLEVHLNYGDRIWQGGAELTVRPGMIIAAGTDGSSLSCGLSVGGGQWLGGYGASFEEVSVEHTAGVLRRLP